jgi:hypothetical protein
MPSQSRKMNLIQFAMSDDLRAEQFGKFTLIGWYAGNSIKLHRPTNTPAAKWKPQLPTIAYSFVLEGGLGEVDAEFELIAPSGKSVLKVSLGSVKFEKVDRAALLLKAPPTAIAEFGMYQAVLRAGGEDFVTSIGVRRGDPMGTLVANNPPQIVLKSKGKAARIKRKRIASQK